MNEKHASIVDYSNLTVNDYFQQVIILTVKINFGI